jgi:hypothetical protein
MRPGALDGKPYAHFWNPELAPLPATTREALLVGPQAAALLPSLAQAPALLRAGRQPIEDGYGFADDGTLHVALSTPMPGTLPPMVDWWFWWHNGEPQRYKLWHPRAHVNAEFGDADSPSRKGRARYVGRTSFVHEYIGSSLNAVAIQFIAPSELGFDEAQLSDPEQATLVCARIGFVEQPLDIGYLVHHVRRVPGGCELRCRFWIGGEAARLRVEHPAGQAVGNLLSKLLRRVKKPTRGEAQDLLVHASQEMAHLASFLPALYRELAGE